MFSKLLILKAELDGLFILTEILGASQTAYSCIPEDENPFKANMGFAVPDLFKEKCCTSGNKNPSHKSFKVWYQNIKLKNQSGCRGHKPCRSPTRQNSQFLLVTFITS